MVEATKRLRDFTAALVFVAVCSAIVSFFQWREMKSTGGQTEKLITANQTLADAAKQQVQASIDNVKIARDSMTASQRAWVGPINARLKGELKVGAPIDSVTQYQNTGKEPATNFLADVKIRTFPASQANFDEIDQKISLDASACFNMEGTNESQVVFPTTGFAAYDITKPLDAEFVDDMIITGEKLILLTGCFAYRTQQTIHHLHFASSSFPTRATKSILAYAKAVIVPTRS